MRGNPRAGSIPASAIVLGWRMWALGGTSELIWHIRIVHFGADVSPCPRREQVARSLLLLLITSLPGFVVASSLTDYPLPRRCLLVLKLFHALPNCQCRPSNAISSYQAMATRVAVCGGLSDTTCTCHVRFHAAEAQANGEDGTHLSV